MLTESKLEASELCIRLKETLVVPELKEAISEDAKILALLSIIELYDSIVLDEII
jgi:hypothetical protein